MHYLHYIVLTALIACGTPEPISPTLDHYVGTQEALANDNFPKAQAALKNLVQHAGPVLKPLVVKAANASDITAVRAAFKPLSAEIIKSEVPEGYVRAYCSMADGDRGAYWIQKDQPRLMNPYFGATMLHCGVFKD